MKIDFKDKVAIVTGATRGIGKRIADDMEELGARLVLTGTRKEEIDELNAMSPPNKKYYHLDLTDKNSSALFLDELKKMDRIDVCINNAGINRIDRIEDTDVKDWDDIVDVNLKGPFLIMRAVSGIMKKNGYGRIVNISSIFGVVSMEKRSIYSTTKSGLIGLTKAVSNEMAKYGVLVNALSPGVVRTDLTKEILGEKGMKEIASGIPAGRLAETDEISRVVLFLASNMNTYLTGKNIVVDGGYVDV